MARCKNSRSSVKNLIVLTLLTTVIVICFSLSRYESTVAGTSKVQVALMANSVQTDLTDMTGKPRRYLVL